MAQSTNTSIEDKKEVKEFKKSSISQADVAKIEKKKAEMQSIKVTKTVDASTIDITKIDENIAQIEDKIKINENNPEFNLVGYKQRLEHLKKLKDQNTK